MCLVIQHTILVILTDFLEILIICQGSISRYKGSLLRHNLKRCPYSRGNPAMEPAAVQEGSRGFWLLTIDGSQIIDS